MAETAQHEMNDEERAQLELVEKDSSALDALVEDLSSASRRKRQFAARVVALLAAQDAELLAPHIDALIDALYRPEHRPVGRCSMPSPASCRSMPRRSAAAFEGAEAALFDELSSTLRFSAFNLLVTWGASERGRSKKVWPILDEAIQCYHGDLEYRDMLACLHTFAEGKIAGEVAEELAGRLQFDAQSGKGAFIKSRSAEIYDLLVKRFKLKDPKKRTRVAPRDDADDADDEE